MPIAIFLVYTAYFANAGIGSSGSPVIELAVGTFNFPTRKSLTVTCRAFVLNHIGAMTNLPAWGFKGPEIGFLALERGLHGFVV